MTEWKTAALSVCVYLNLWHSCIAQADNNTFFVFYRHETSNDDRRIRWMVEDLNRELQENRNISSCGGNVTLCVKSSQCIEEENNRTDGECAILVYKHTRVRERVVDIHVIEDENNTRSLSHDGEGEHRTDGIQAAEKPTPAQDNGRPMLAQDHLCQSPTILWDFLLVWGFGILAVGIISLSGLFGAVFWPLMKTDFYAQMMWILIGLAVGSLTASATFQLIPEGFRLKEHNPDYLNTALFMWSSFWVLYMFESLAKIFFQSNPATAESNAENEIPLKTKRKDERSKEEFDDIGLMPATAVGNGNQLANKNIPLYMSQSSLHSLSFQKSSHMHSHSKRGPGEKTATVAWMIIIGDGIHNFIDGMSIGAGFSNSVAVGTSISIAIACEEFPHELGDFAILINSGMPVKRALLYNFLSACTAFAGLVLGILLGEIDASVYIFAFAGGLFLYIALTDLMPELNEMLATGLKKSRKSALFVLLLQNVGIFIGVTILYIVTKLPINLN